MAAGKKQGSIFFVRKALNKKAETRFPPAISFAQRRTFTRVRHGFTIERSTFTLIRGAFTGLRRKFTNQNLKSYAVR